MAAVNFTPYSSSIFILNGIPGLEADHIWISIPFCTLYFISLLGNFTVLLTVAREQTLHKPMYLLFCMLAFSEIGISTAIMPKTLCIFWFGFKDITMDGCLTQMFFFHGFASMHSAILVSMAFDRYVTICDPLRYPTILTNGKTAKLGLLGLIRALLLGVPGMLLLRRLPFCANRVIPHTFCEHLAVVKMSCRDATLDRIYSVVVTVATTCLDLMLIGLSYGLIIWAVLRISSKKAHQKVLNTCAAHIGVILISYITTFFYALIQMFGQSFPALTHILVSNLYVLVPPVLNPIIYGAKTKEIRDKVGKYTCNI